MRWTKPLKRKANPDARLGMDEPSLMSFFEHHGINCPDEGRSFPPEHPTVGVQQHCHESSVHTRPQSASGYLSYAHSRAGWERLLQDPQQAARVVGICRARPRSNHVP